MTLLDELRSRLSNLLEQPLAQRAAAETQIDQILDAMQTEGRSDPTSDETKAISEARARVQQFDDQIAAIKSGDEYRSLTDRIAEFEARAEARARAEELSRSLPTVGETSSRGGGVVRREARTYNPEAERTEGRSFMADLVAGRLAGDPDANARLFRHMQEERVERPGLESRAVGTSAFAGLVVPQYLVDLVAPTRRAGRPLANIAAKHALPDKGMTVEISRITTGSTAANQSQNNGASEQNMDDTVLSVSVLTAAAQQTASVQAINRGSGVEPIILGDLLGAVNTLIDSTMITQATTGLDAVTDNNLDIAYTDADPTAAELWPKLFDAIQRIQTNYFGGASHFVMHPRRFWWLAAQVGTNFPFVNLLAGPQAGGRVDTTAYGEGASGVLGGLPVILDANIATNQGAGTNQDAIYAITADEVHLWENDAVFIRAEQTNAASLGVLFVVYKDYAYTVSRYPNAHARILGTGLVAPTF